MSTLAFFWPLFKTKYSLILFHLKQIFQHEFKTYIPDLFPEPELPVAALATILLSVLITSFSITQDKSGGTLPAGLIQKIFLQ